jgi:hypothetical protein
LKDLNEIIIPHFKAYPLLSTKAVTLLSWVKCIELINKNRYKNEKDFYAFLSLYASIGRGPSKKVMEIYPDLIPEIKPAYTIPKGELSEYWLSGYFCIYCNFNVNVNPHGWKNTYYNRVVTSFNFSRTIEELPLMELIAYYFNVIPNIRSNELRVDVNVYGLEKSKLIVDLFTSFPLISVKQREFIKWSEIVNKLSSISDMPSIHGLSLDHYMPMFYILIKELNDIRSFNKS